MGPFLERGFSFRATSRTGIKNWPISRTGYQFQGNFFLEQGTNLESRAAHTHPKNTQAPPPRGGGRNNSRSIHKGSNFRVRLYRIPWNNSKEKVFAGARENKLPKLQISQNEILHMKIFTCVFSIQVKFEIFFSGFHKKLSGVITDNWLHL